MSRRQSRDTEPDEGLRRLGPSAPLRRRSVLAGRYVIGASLGEGGTGSVFKAYDRATKTHVALKVVRPEVAGRRSAIDRLGREVGHARAVQHPNVCRVFELSESNGCTFYTMELGRSSLRATLKKRSQRALAERLGDAVGLTAGLAAIHAAGIVHRDFKPENVLRMAGGRLAVSDFGLAQRTREAAPSRSGTDGYIAPEVLAGKPASARSDVWALGVVLHEVLFGARPGTRSRPEGRHEAALWELCEECLSLRPSARPATAAKVLTGLEALNGETLDQRLKHGHFAVDEALRLQARLLEGLAVVHRSGKRHGAIAPENIFVARDGNARLLDGAKDPMTIATIAPAYLSPEQARGTRGLDVRADIFSVGCVLLECLTGVRPDGRRPTVQTLARRSLGIAVELPERGLPQRVRELLNRMLATERTQRPADAAALASELLGLASRPTNSAGASGHQEAALTAEQRLASVVAIRFREQRGSPSHARSTLESFGGSVVRHEDTLVAVRTGPGTPSDLAAAAARCALTLRVQVPTASIVVGAGRVGQSSDPAARSALALLGETPSGAIRLDARVADLLNPRFEVARQGAPTLLSEYDLADRPRTVLGRPIPCVGRERELETLMALWRECVSERAARTVLVTSPAGGGKSRLRHELTAALAREGARFTLLLGRGDAMRAGAPFAMLGPALRDAAGLGKGETCDKQLLLAHTKGLVDVDRAPHVAAFLGEMCGVPFPDADLPALAAARQDPRLMADQTRAAWLEYLEASCRTQPVLLLLEDLHWGDAASIQLVDAGLRTLREHPLLVLALARPEIDDRFDNLWRDRDLQRIALSPLSDRSAAALIRHAIADLPAESVAWIVNRGCGNAFYLEELVRAFGASAGAAMPDTVVGMAQARFDVLGADAKRVLRAASIFGELFPPAGVRHLLGRHASDTAQVLEMLVEKEVLFARHGHTDELAFRHALLQEAAYDMITGEDRRLGHRRAAEYLERRGERNAILLVEHHERGGDRARAAHWCRIAAEQALDANDLATVIVRADRCVRLGARGEELGAARLAEAQARNWRGEYREAEAAARVAQSQLLGPQRFVATREIIFAQGQLAEFQEVAAATEALLQLHPPEAERSAWLDCLVRATGYLMPGGRAALADVALDLISENLRWLDRRSHARLVAVKVSQSWHRSQKVAALAHCEQAAAEFEALGDARSATEMRANAGTLLGDVGLLDRSLEHQNAALDLSQRFELTSLRTMILANVTLLHAWRGDAESARSAGLGAIQLARQSGDKRAEGAAATHLAIGAVLKRAFPEAEQYGRLAVESLAGVPTALPHALAVLAISLLGQGRTAEAIVHSAEAYRLLQTVGLVEDGEVTVCVAHAACLLAQSDLPVARTVLARGCSILARQAQELDLGWRHAFFALPHNARLIELADSLGMPFATTPRSMA